MNEKYNPCPFCGSNDIVHVTIHDGLIEDHYVFCKKCGNIALLNLLQKRLQQKSGIVELRWMM